MKRLAVIAIALLLGLLSNTSYADCTLLFSDSFEYSDSPSNHGWDLIRPANVKTSPNRDYAGQRSLYLTRGAWADYSLNNIAASSVSSISVWYYDDMLQGDDNSSPEPSTKGIMAYVTFDSALQLGQWLLLRWENSLTYSIESSFFGRQATSVSRSLGWHHFEWVIENNKVSACIDNFEVASEILTVTTVNEIHIGVRPDSWGFFDNVEVCGTDGETGVSPFITITPSCASMGTPVTISINTNTNGAYFKYFVNENSYCGAGAASWTLLKDWTTDTSVSWSPLSNGRKTVVVHVTDDTASECVGMIGASYEVGGSDCIDPVSVSLDPASGRVNEPVTITANGAANACSYRFFVNHNSHCDSGGANWELLQDWSADNACAWTPTDEGLYTLVVWTTDDTGNSCTGMGGMTYELKDAVMVSPPTVAANTLMEVLVAAQ